MHWKYDPMNVPKKKMRKYLKIAETGSTEEKGSLPFFWLHSGFCIFKFFLWIFNEISWQNLENPNYMFYTILFLFRRRSNENCMNIKNDINIIMHVWLCTTNERLSFASAYKWGKMLVLFKLLFNVYEKINGGFS